MVDQLVRFAFKFTKDLALAQDVVADKIEDARLSINTYDPRCYRGKKCPFRNWIYFMLSRAANRKARQAAHRQIQILQAQAKAQQQQQQLLAACSQRASELEWTDVQPHFDRLSPVYQQALLLCLRDGLSRAEAAYYAGCSEGAMKVRLHRARQEVRRLMEEQNCLDELLAQLQPDERQAIILIEQRGLSPAEAAHTARCSEHEMEKRLF